MDLVLTLIRVAIGLGLAAHGAQKLFGWFGGYGIAGTGGFFESIGFRPGKPMAIAAGVSEFAGGLLLAAGLATPIGAMLILGTMTVAIGFHWPKFFAGDNGLEVAGLYALGAVIFAVLPATTLSLDYALGLAAVFTPAFVAIALALGIIGGLANLAMRKKPAPAPAA